MNRYARRVDTNHAEVVAALRAIGCTVYDASAVGGGFPDLVVGYRGKTMLLEVKDGARSPSRQTLTPDQVFFHAEWRGHKVIVRSVDEAIAAVQAHTLARAA